MSTNGIIVLSIAIVVLLASVWIMWRYDRPKFFDHISRSLVQMAIAATTVFVAFTILDKQFAQRSQEEMERGTPYCFVLPSL
jgi:NADH:ubiquinone oxidoreductase subunit 6 (subunit J)